MRNDMLYRLRRDPETFRLDMIVVPEPGSPPQRRYLTLERIQEQFRELDAARDEEPARQRRAFLAAALQLISGERHQRQLLKRKTTPGARIIPLPILEAAAYAEETLYPEMTGKHRKKTDRTKNEQMRYDDLKNLISETIAPIKAKLGLPAEDPVQWSYAIPESLIAKVDGDCRDYLKRLRTQGILTEHLFAKCCAKLRADFPEQAAAIISTIAETRNREHLSAISFDSIDGQLVVSIVNQRGDLFTLEGWKLLRLIEEHETVLTIGSLDRKGSWQPEPLLKLSNNRAGELVAVYTAHDSTLQVVCRQENVTAQGKVRTATPDRASFVLDQTYLVSLYVAILQLKEDKTRFEALREEAEAKKAANIDELFDSGLFEVNRKGGQHHVEGAGSAGGDLPA